ncbi:dephospho-CoA kinase [Domibacillus indicus]|uniref:dephospho-CoA kinase n=1 Tax=Domibacillus indicus TaxID=1437523 RepID=UPI0006181777|nr:dephospho-CoA kinase [Domibacillus indicus]
MIIGLTGGIASGKSTVSQLLKNKGFTVIDADIASRAVVMPGQPVLEQIVQLFGNEMLFQDGTLNRKKLGEVIFGDEFKRKQLNEIIHPAVRTWMLSEKDKAIAAGCRTIIFDIPLLFESKLAWMAERTLLIYVTPEIQLERLMNRNGYTEKEAMDRIESQMPINEKKKLADDMIDNSGTIDKTKEQLDHWLAQLRLSP